MKKITFAILFFTGIFVTTGCDTEIELESREGNIVKISAPKIARVGQTIVAEIEFEGRNGCSRPKEATYGIEENVYRTKAFYTHPKDARVQCTEEIPTFREQIYITLAIKGPVYIRSFSNPDIFAEVLVEDGE
jgi:hypothetical protein